MFTNDKILYFLKYLKDHNGSKGEHLGEIIETHLSINYMTTHATFLNDVEKKGYISHDNTTKYYITKKGKWFIHKHNISKIFVFAIKYIIPIIILTIVILTFIFQFIWKPDFLTTEKAKKNQREIMDSKPDTLSKKDSILIPK